LSDDGNLDLIEINENDVSGGRLVKLLDGCLPKLATVALAALLIPSDAFSAVDVKLTGFIKAGVIGSTRSVQSFGYEEYTAPTAARPEITLANGSTVNDDGGLSFQTAQTRFGLAASIDENTKGVLEFDFVDFTKSSPTTQMYPRVRIAKIEYRFNEHTLLQAGQDWDIFAPLNTFSYNYVGTNFQAGNLGFMRQQAIVVFSGDNFEQKAALGLFAANPTSSLTDIERSDIPTVAYSAAWGSTPNRFGLSAIYSKFIVRPAGSRELTDMYGLNVFAEQKLGSFDLRAEAYYGQNTGNAGTLSLSTRPTVRPAPATPPATTPTVYLEDLREAGGWVSARMPLSETTNLFGTIGYAQILNAEDVSPIPASATATTQINNIKQNLATKIGTDHKLTDKLSVYGEATYFNTLFAGPGTAEAYVADVGLFLFL
jgi:hypothetical protein